MYNELLVQAGLTSEQATLYQTLLKNGPSLASKISLETGIKRSLVYKIFAQLEALGLLEKQEKAGAITRFSPTHPSKLKELLEKKEKDIKSASTALQSVLGGLISEHNLLSGKPNIQFYEGVEGIKSVLDDSLYAKEEIYSYADGESVMKYIPEINKKYLADREKLSIKKKAFIFDTENARKLFAGYSKLTDIKFIPCASNPFQTVMQIYDNKISYITLSEKDMIGVIVEDPHIYRMHRFIFEMYWNTIPKNEPKQEKASDTPIVFPA